MKCARCNDDAVVRRDETDFCTRCSISADWQTLIAAIQDARVETPVAGGEIAQTV